MTSFDNIGKSILTVSQTITRQGWTPIMYNYMNSSNLGVASVFFCVIIVFGSYFLLNLVLAVIIDAYNKIDIKE